MSVLDEQLVQWVICTYAEYHAMESHPNTKLYFLYDTEEIYRGDIPFTTSILFYTKERPKKGARRKIYVDTNTLDGYIYENNTWRRILTQYTIVSGVADNTPDTAIPNVRALRQYIETAISDMEYDSETCSIKYTQGSKSKSVMIDDIFKSAEIDEVTNELRFKNVHGDVFAKVIIPKDKFLTGGVYDPATKSIVLSVTANDGSGKKSDIIIPVEDLIKVEISAVEGNLLKEYPDGYGVIVDLSGKMDKIVITDDDQIGCVIISSNDGNALPTRFQIGGPHLSMTTLDDGSQQPKDNLLATEMAVYNWVQSMKESIEVLKQLTITHSINRDNPSQTKYPSEVAIVSLWNTIETNLNNLDTSVKRSIRELTDSSQNNASDIEELAARIDEISDTFSGDLEPIRQSIEHLGQQISTNSSNISTNRSDIDTLTNSVNDMASMIEDIDGAITTLESNHSADITVLTQSLSDLNQRVSTLYSQQTNIETTLNNKISTTANQLSSQITALDERVRTLEGIASDFTETAIQYYSQ